MKFSMLPAILPLCLLFASPISADDINLKTKELGLVMPEPITTRDLMKRMRNFQARDLTTRNLQPSACFADTFMFNYPNDDTPTPGNQIEDIIEEEFFFCNPDGSGDLIFDTDEHCAYDFSAGTFKCFMDASFLADKIQNDVCGPAGRTVHVVERHDTCEEGAQIILGVPQCLATSCESFEAFMEEYKLLEAAGVFAALVPDYQSCATVNYWTASALESQSQYHHISYAGASAFDWNITITDFMSIDKPTTDQGIYNLRSSYILDDRSYDVELFKADCETAPSGIDSFPLVFKDATNDDTTISLENSIELEWTYNQTKIESSDLWTANKTGGYSEFCIRVNNYLEENDNPFAREIHFLEVKYRIEVDSLTDFNETITVDRIDATDGGTELINYEEEITVFQCKDDYTEITSPAPPLTQGDFLQLCVTTVTGSKFGVHSVKELDVSQEDDTPSLYPYVDGFNDSPLAESMCKAEVKNTSAAVCKTKMQLLSAYFDLDNPDDLFANGTVKLDYVGRRLSVDVPVSLRYGDSGIARGADDVAAGRVLAEEDKEPSFGIEVGLSGNAGQSDASTSVQSMGGLLFAAGMTFLAAGMV